MDKQLLLEALLQISRDIGTGMHEGWKSAKTSQNYPDQEQAIGLVKDTGRQIGEVAYRTLPFAKNAVYIFFEPLGCPMKYAHTYKK